MAQRAWTFTTAQDRALMLKPSHLLGAVIDEYHHDAAILPRGKRGRGPAPRTPRRDRTKVRGGWAPRQGARVGEGGRRLPLGAPRGAPPADPIARAQALHRP